MVWPRLDLPDQEAVLLQHLGEVVSRLGPEVDRALQEAGEESPPSSAEVSLPLAWAYHAIFLEEDVQVHLSALLV